MIAMIGTMYIETFAMRLRPPMMTVAAKIVTMRPAIAVVTLTEFPPMLTNSAAFGVRRAMALVMPLTCVMVPMPRRPAAMPKMANITASHFMFQPKRSLIPVSM